MKIPCGIIHDLMPLYIDEVCGEESRAMVEGHLAECGACRTYFDEMRSGEAEAANADKDMKLADGMKKLKNRFDRRMMIGVGCAVLMAMAVFMGFEALYNLPLKKLGPENVKVEAMVYSVDELPVLEAHADETAVSIRKGEDDLSDIYSVRIPDLSGTEIHMTGNVLDEAGYITLVNWGSDYHLRLMNWGDGTEEGTIYVGSIKTSILNNKIEESMRSQVMMEMRKIDRIVYINEDGSETVMWEAPANIPEAE